MANVATIVVAPFTDGGLENMEELNWEEEAYTEDDKAILEEEEEELKGIRRRRKWKDYDGNRKRSGRIWLEEDDYELLEEWEQDRREFENKWWIWSRMLTRD